MPTQSPFVGHGQCGQKAGERFEISGKLGAGGLGVVYRAFDAQRGAEIAIKTLREVTGSDLYRFKREFRTIADVTHPNQVPCALHYARAGENATTTTSARAAERAAVSRGHFMGRRAASSSMDCASFRSSTVIPPASCVDRSMRTVFQTLNHSG